MDEFVSKPMDNIRDFVRASQPEIASETPETSAPASVTSSSQAASRDIPMTNLTDFTMGAHTDAHTEPNKMRTTDMRTTALRTTELGTTELRTADRLSQRETRPGHRTTTFMSESRATLRSSLRRSCTLVLSLLTLAVAGPLAAEGTQDKVANLPTETASTDAAPASSLKRLSAVQVTTPPHIDGNIVEPLWSEAAIAEGFTQRDPNNGSPSTQSTQVRVAYDSTNVYVAGHLLDSVKNGMTCRLTRRDRDSESDWFGVLFDGYHDRKTGRIFMVNASGVQRDATVSNDSQMDDSWDGVWESAIRCTETGWSVEMRIPLSALRFSAMADATWGFNAMRYISRLKEESWWSPVSRTSQRFVSAAGELQGLQTSRAPLRLALIPYAASSVSVDSDGKGNADAQLHPNVGLDMQYGISSDMILDVTVNPDFGQVEVDQAVIRLTAFQTFFPEKRPFFLEGSDILSTVGSFGDDGGNGTRLFYSRRIGLDMPIMTAAKITGRTSGGLSVGVLDAISGFSIAKNLDPGLAGAPEEAMNQAVARVRQEVGENSYVGGIVTALNRPEALGHDAYSGALDGIYRTSDGTYSVSALLAGSSLTGTPEDPTRPVQGAEGMVIASKDSGEHLVGAASYSFVTKDFQVNDMGYNQRVDQQGGWTWLQYRKTLDSGFLREFRINQNNWYFRQLSTNLVAGQGLNVNVNGKLRNFTHFYSGAGFDLEAYDPYEVETGGHNYLRPTTGFAFAGFSSDSRRKMTVNLNANAGKEVTGGSYLNVSPTLEVHLGSQGELSVGGGYSAGLSQLEWAYTEDNGLPVFGERSYTQLEATARGSFTFTDKLSLQFFGQLLSIIGVYKDFQALNLDGTLGTYSPTCGAACPNPNFDIQYFNTNAIMRWEYRPGSTFYAVWTQTRELGKTDASGALVQEVASNFTHGANNSFLLKFNYRWGT